MRTPQTLLLILLGIFLSACTRSAPIDTAFTPLAPGNVARSTLSPVQTFLPPTRAANAPIATPTPDREIVLLPTFTPLSPGAQSLNDPGKVTYTVQSGDFLGKIAQSYGITIEELAEANNLNIYTSILYPGDVLIIPIPPEQARPTQAALTISSEYFKIIPDSELVYSPLGTLLNIEAYIRQKGGYLAYYKQEVDGETLTGAQIVERVALNYSVNPRLLLAVLEYRAQWVSNANPSSTSLETPIHYIDDTRIGLYRQLAWTADRLNAGFYGWREEQLKTLTLRDGVQVAPHYGLNAGTVGVQSLFAQIGDQSAWKFDTSQNGLYATYTTLFGYPFDWAIEPLLPANLSQPNFMLPFEPGDIWAFTGGPHGGWDSGSAWAALDFVPPDLDACNTSDTWVTAIADGLIVRSENGTVMQDLDGDGLEQTGWNILYMHISSRGKAQTGQYVRAGERIGHASCEGGFSNATHLHIARKYNGVWIPVDAPGLHFVMDGWQPERGDREYNGFLRKNDLSLQAWQTVGPINQIQRP